MLDQLIKSVGYNESLDMMYIVKDGTISKRRINILQVGKVSLHSYCFLRKPKRTFIIDNILAIVLIKSKESMVI